MILDLFNKEIEENQRGTNCEYLDMIEKFQTALTAVEKEKEALRIENGELALSLAMNVEKVNHLIKENQTLQNSYNDILSQFDLANLKQANIVKEKEELEQQLKDVKDKYEKAQTYEQKETEKRNEEFATRLQQLAKENKILEERLSTMLLAKSSSEDIQNITQIQLNEFKEKYKVLKEENEKLRVKLDNMFKEKTDLLNMLDARSNELDELKRKYKNDIERISMEHANKLKEVESDHKKLRERTVTGLDANISPGQFMANSNLSEFMFEDHDRNTSFRNIMEKQSIRDLIKQGSISLNRQTEDFKPPISNKLIKVPYEEEEFEQEIQYLEQLEEKDKEISKLRQQISELKEKTNRECKLNPNQEEMIKKLTLDIKHEKENYRMLKKTTDEERVHNDKAIKDLEHLLIQTKLKYQMECDEKDKIEVKLMKKIKMLNYHIQLYEDQIKSFNKYAKKK